MLEAAKLMKWTDPNIKLIAAGSSNFGQGIDWIGWNRTVLEHLKRHIDYLAIHLYVGNRDNDYYEFLTSSLDLDERIRTTEGIINAAMSSEPRNRRVFISPGMSGTSGIVLAAHSSADGVFWKSITTSKMRWLSLHS